MRYNKSFLLLLLFSLLGTGLMAQKGKLRKAKRLMEDYNYQAAIDVYLKVLEKYDESEAKLNIAECYRMLRNSDEMEYWYGQVSLMPQAPPITLLYYAQALQMNGKCQKATKWVREYLKLMPDDTRARFLEKACEESMVDNLRASGDLYDLEVRPELSSNADDFSPVLYKDGEKERVIISSTRDRVKLKFPTKIVEDKWTEDGFAQLFDFELTLKDEKKYIYDYGKPEKYAKKIRKTPRHIGPITFNADQTQAYFSATDLDGKAGNEDGVLRQKIYLVNKKGDKWDKPEGVDFNDEGYNVMHPSLSKDGTMLFFASDMPGGFGGLDLYASYMEAGRWSVPVNLGPTVNTEGDEAFPFAHGEGVDMTLYFASNGLIGLGGLDIYKVTESYGAWLDPVNLGYPINSNKDDFSITMNETKTYGLIASNRDNGEGQGDEGVGDQIYSFTKLSISVEVIVFDKTTEMPIEGAMVYTACSSVDSYTTNRDGKAFLEVGLDNPCDFAAEMLNYRPNNVRTKAADIKPGQTVVIQIPLDLERVFDVGGTVIDGYSEQPLGNALVRLKSDCEGTLNELSTLTDETGYYEFLEINEDCDYQLIVSKDGYTKSSSTFTTKNIGKGDEAIEVDLAINCLPGTADCPDQKKFPEDCLPTGKQDENGYDECEDQKGNKNYIDVNGNTIYMVTPEGDTIWFQRPEGVPEIVHIFYDFNRANIRPDARPGLDSLVAFLEMFPQASVRFTSHTDARGKRRSNQRLSNRRAESVVRYLMRKGIPKKRLKAKGMGEKVMLNDCYDGIPCTEEEHQENRRTEFTIIDWKEDGTELKSLKRMDGISVDPCQGCPEAPAVEEADGLNAPTSSTN